MLALVSLSREAPDYKIARHTFFELCVIIGALTQDEADADAIKEQDAQIDKEAAAAAQPFPNAASAILQHVALSGMNCV